MNELHAATIALEEELYLAARQISK